MKIWTMDWYGFDIYSEKFNVDGKRTRVIME